MMTIALKLEFGVSHNLTFERVDVHFTVPLHVSTRVADNDATLLLQALLRDGPLLME